MVTRRRRTNSEEDRQSRTFVEVSYSSQDTFSQSLAEMSSCRDRTSEFLSVVKSLQSRQGKALSLVRPERANGRLLQRNEFTKIAKKIGHDITNTFAKLEKLTILARKKSLFDDRPVEIQELTYIIKQDINNLNKQIAQLQELVRARGRSDGKQRQTHSNTIVLTLQSKLAKMSKDFKSVLELRTENLKQQKVRRDQFSQGPLMDGSSSMAGNSVLGWNDSTDGRNGRVPGNSAVSIDVETLEQRNQPDMQIQQQETYIRERRQLWRALNQLLLNWEEYFNNFATMVKEQEEQIQTIDSNVEEAELNVDSAHQEILKYFQSVTSNRWLIIKIFFVLIVFFIIFVVFMA